MAAPRVGQYKVEDARPIDGAVGPTDGVAAGEALAGTPGMDAHPATRSRADAARATVGDGERPATPGDPATINKKGAPASAPSLQPVDVKKALLQRRRDGGHCGVQAGADRFESGDDGHADSRGNQAIFDGRGTILIAQKLQDLSSKTHLLAPASSKSVCGLTHA